MTQMRFECSLSPWHVFCDAALLPLHLCNLRHLLHLRFRHLRVIRGGDENDFHGIHNRTRRIGLTEMTGTANRILPIHLPGCTKRLGEIRKKRYHEI